jgi:predicted ferric reductase
VLVAESPGLRVYMVGLAGLGLAGALYKLVVVPRQAGNHRYVVDATHNLNDEVMEIELVPQRPDENIGFFPGQFVWVTFEHENLSREAHPFTICSPAGASRLRLTVKALGDFTSDLHRHLMPGTPVRVEGPYGRFDYRQGAPKQVWIAGGVGVAPFLSWARHMAETDDRTHDVEFYYCVHSRGDAVYLEELQSIGDALPTLKIALVCSVEDGHLHAEDVADLDDRDIFLCGPQRLIQDLTQQFRTLGVSRGRIHAEDFEFREA